jgi:cytochrome c oxidase subunit 2
MKLSYHPKSVALFVALIALPVALSGKGDLKRGEELFATCIACHGADGGGNPIYNTPRLVEQHDWYLVRQLENFKEGLRGYEPEDIYGIQMKAIADMLSDDDVEDVVAYIGTLDAPVSPATVEGDPLAGKKQFKRCQLCHGNKAEGKKRMFTPNLRRQHDWYQLRQLENYRRSFRGTHPEDNFGGRMWAIARTIEDEQTLKDIVAYVKSLE